MFDHHYPEAPMLVHDTFRGTRAYESIRTLGGYFDEDGFHEVVLARSRAAWRRYAVLELSTWRGQRDVLTVARGLRTEAEACAEAVDHVHDALRAERHDALL